MKNAFTIIELIFVIVILGILAIVVVPKLSATRDDARISTRADEIVVATLEVAAYALSKGSTADTMSEMSNVVRTLVRRGEAVELAGPKAAMFRFGAENDCIRLQLDEDARDSNLSIRLNDATADGLCRQLQETVDTADYPIPLRGARVAK